MTNTEKVEHLQRAMAEIEAVEANLDYRCRECEGCKLVIRENYTEARTRENLSALRRKLDRIIHSIHSW